MSTRILGISAYYHDSAACLVEDGRIVAAAQEERFSRIKNDSDFPKRAAEFCLHFAGLKPAELDAVVFYDKPVLKFTRLLETYLAVAPGGWRTFPEVFSNWLGGKLDLRKTIRQEWRSVFCTWCRLPKPWSHPSRAKRPRNTDFWAWRRIEVGGGT